MAHKTLRTSPGEAADFERGRTPGTAKAKADHRYLGGMIKHHPNKHAEGDRKRWMGAISEGERKRYEGAWAANKGGSLGALETRIAEVPGGFQGSGADGTEREPMGPEDVHGFVVRDIWQRSGLEGRILEEVWELVEGGGRVRRGRRVAAVAAAAAGLMAGDAHAEGGERRRGWLKRDEFVVGMWLVDQALKGRKLPVEVGESVWASARGLMSGLMVR